MTATQTGNTLAEKELDRHWHPPGRDNREGDNYCEQLGLHIRPAGMFVRLASRFESMISVAKKDVEVDGKSVMALISLAATKGATLRIRVKGPDAREAMREIEQLIQSRFEED